ncbi:MAG TPA: S41 family peptidase [Gemmataceae bacterium]|nr:S41 family peptidase [Gemmataceae bacterium]
MTRTLAFSAIVFVSICALASAEERIRLANNPALSPDGSVLAFDWNGDIWTVGINGGRAKRLTAHPAKDRQPKFSPDGKQIAFVSEREGTPQVFVMSAEGGSPVQMTFHTAGYELLGWAPDGKRLLVSSQRDNFWRHADRYFLVSADGKATEEMLFDDYGQNGMLSPNGRQLLFSREGAPWWRKGYRGSQASQIWLYDLEKKYFEPFPQQSDSGCLWPLWKPDGVGLYYVSGRSGSFQLWEHPSEVKGVERQLTTMPGDDSVVFPCISKDGNRIVFRHLFDFYQMVPGSAEPPHPIEILADVDRPAERMERRVLQTATQVAFSSDGLEIAFIAGGDLWVMDTELREPKQVTTTAEEERSPVFSADGEWLYFVSDRDGRSEVYRAKRGDGSKYWWQNSKFIVEPLTKDGKQKFNLTLSPDGSHVAFLSERGDLNIMSPDGKDVHTFVKSFSPVEYNWSPDGQWLTFSKEDENFNRDVFIQPVDGSKEPFNVSRHPRNDHNPVWSPDGKIIAFTGQRGEERDIFYVFLRADDDETTNRDRLMDKALEKMKGRSKLPFPSSKDGEMKSMSAKKNAVVIDFAGLHERIHRVSIPNATETNLFWSPDSKKLAFTATIDGKLATYSVDIPDDLKPKELTSQVGTQARWLSRGNQIVWLSGGLPASFSAGGGAARTTPTPAPAAPSPGPGFGRGLRGQLSSAASSTGDSSGYRFQALQTVNTAERYAAVFDLCWRTMRDHYYDENLGKPGRDWRTVRDKYMPMARQAPDMDTVSTVVNLMLGELNGSHLGFYAGIRDITQRRQGPQTDDPPTGRWRETTGHLGVRFDESFTGPGLKIRDVLPNSPASSKKTRLEAGEIILKIDGTAVDAKSNLTKLLTGPMDREIALSVRGTDGKEREVAIRPISFAQVRTLLYDYWLESNRKAVDELSNHKLGYLHIAAMDMNSFYKFEEQLFAAGAGKDGLVIDVRENGGGSTTDHLLTCLTQPVHALTVPRGGDPKTAGYPQDRTVYATWHKPIVVLCNQNSFSNAEIFSHSIKTLGRGKLIGVQTAGGVISTGGTAIMDAGLLRLPFRGWYLVKDGQDMELNGARPDVEIWPRPGDMPRGKDDQLEKAVAVLQDEVMAEKAKQPFQPKKASERK